MAYLINTETNRLFVHSDVLVKRNDMRDATKDEVAKLLGKPSELGGSEEPEKKETAKKPVAKK